MARKLRELYFHESRLPLNPRLTCRIVRLPAHEPATDKVFSCYQSEVYRSGSAGLVLWHPLRRHSVSTAADDGLPRLPLWAWERPEDLRGLDTGKSAIAYLDQTLTLGLDVHSQPRRDPILFPATAARIPVVRIETDSEAILDDTTRGQAIDSILSSARQAGMPLCR